MVDAPHDLDLERALLAAIIKDNAVLDQLGSFSGDQFFDAMHGAVFDTMLDLRRGGRAINAVTLRELTGSDPLGGTSLLDSLKAVTFADDAASPHDVAFELAILATRRAMIGRGDWLAEQAKGSHAKPADILAIHLGEIDTLIAKARPQGKTMWDWPDAMSAAQDVFQADKSADHIPTGLTDLDKATGGWARTELAILAGRPSMGKSALAVCFGTNAARAGHGVLIFSLEMSMPAWMARVSSEATWSGEGSGIPYAHALRHQLKGKELEAFMRAGNRRTACPV